MWMLERKGCFPCKWKLENDSICTIGRCQSSTICCKSSYVSRYHCTIKVNADRIIITDLKSTNGTFINGDTIDHSVDKALKDGDEIGLGIDGKIELINEPDIFIFNLKKIPSTDNHSAKFDIDLTNDDIVEIPPEPEDNKVGNTASCVTNINPVSHLIANNKSDTPNNFIEPHLINDQNILSKEIDNPTSEKSSVPSNTSFKIEQITIDGKDSGSKKSDANSALNSEIRQSTSSEKNIEEETKKDAKPGSSKRIDSDDDCDLMILDEICGGAKSSSKFNQLLSNSNKIDTNSKQSFDETFKQPNDDSMTRLSLVRKRQSAVDIAPPAKQMKISFDSTDVSMEGTSDSNIDNNTTDEGRVLKIKKEHDYSQIDTCVVLQEEEGGFPCSQLFDNHEQNISTEIIISDESDNENDNDVCVVNSDDDDDDELAVNPWLLKLSQSKSPPRRDIVDDENYWWPDLSQTLDEVDALRYESSDGEREENNGRGKDSNKGKEKSSSSSKAAELKQMPVNEQEESKELNVSDPKTVDVIRFYSPDKKPAETKKSVGDSKEKLPSSKTHSQKDDKEKSLHSKTRSQTKHTRAIRKDDKTSSPIVKTKNTMNNAYSNKKSIDEELKKRKAISKTRNKSKSSKSPTENNKSIVDERKKRLKELALKQKDTSENDEVKVLSRAKAKVTKKNRSTFLAEDIAGVTLSQMDSTLIPENSKKSTKVIKDREIKLEEPDLDTTTSNNFDLECPPTKRKLSSAAEFNPEPSTSGQSKSLELNISTANARKKSVSQIKLTEAKAQPVRSRRKSTTENVPPQIKQIKLTEAKAQPAVSKRKSSTESAAPKKSNHKKKEVASVSNSDSNVNKIDSTDNKGKPDAVKFDDNKTSKIEKLSFKNIDKPVSIQKKQSGKSNIENENKTVSKTKKTEIHSRKSILRSHCNENNKIQNGVTNEARKSVQFNLVPKVITIERVVHNKIEPKRNYEHLMHRKLEEVLFLITKWKVSWLVEQKIIKKPPPVSPIQLQYMLSTFTSYSDYYQIVLPLMLYEMWSEIFESWESMRKRLCYGSVYNIQPFHVANNVRMMKIDCAVLINDADTPDTSPKAGDLVVIEIASKCDGGKVEFTSVFAYVENHTRRRTRQKEDYFLTDVLHHVSNPNTVLSLSLKSRFLDKQMDLSRAMRIRSVHYIRPSIRSIEAVINLPFSPLVELILNPKNIVCTLDKLNEELFTKNKLNPNQMRAVFETCQTCLQPEPNICLIHGPPGTGKTLVIINIILQLLYGNQRYEKSQQPRILVCTPSNAAIDNITQTLLEIRATLTHRFKMVRVGRVESSNAFVKGISLNELVKKHIDENNKQTVMDSVKIEVDTLKAKMNCIAISIESALAKQIDTTLLEKQLLDCKRRHDALSNNDNSKNNHAPYKVQEAEERILCRADIVCTTLGSSFSGQIGHLLKNKKNHFTCCIIDEATQCTEPEILVPLMHGIKSLVLVGDTCQLPGTVKSQESKEHGYGQSLFGRIQKTFEHEAVSPVKFLNIQYRMHPDICSWPNNFFYSAKLINSPSTLIKTPLAPYKVFSHEFTESEQMTNVGEADLIIKLLKTSLSLLKECNYTIGIITPYQRQKQLICDMILKEIRSSSVKRKIEVKTVDGYQGRESDIIIVSCVRSHKIGFLSDFERLNVALTRARRALYICVNFSTLIENSVWKALKLDAIQRKMYTYVGKKNVTESNLKSMLTQTN